MGQAYEVDVLKTCSYFLLLQYFTRVELFLQLNYLRRGRHLTQKKQRNEN